MLDSGLWIVDSGLWIVDSGLFPFRVLGLPTRLSPPKRVIDVIYPADRMEATCVGE